MPIPTEFIFGLLIGVAIGVAGGAAAAWLIVANRAITFQTVAVAVEERRTAAAEAVLEETRKHLSDAHSEVRAARETVRKYEAAWNTARTRLVETEKNLYEQKALVEQAKV